MVSGKNAPLQMGKKVIGVLGYLYEKQKLLKEPKVTSGGLLVEKR